MEVYAVVIAAISAIVGVAGVIIAWVKAKKVYVCKDDFNKSTERAHTRIDKVEDKVNALEKTTDVLSHKIGSIQSDISEIKYDVKNVSKMGADVARLTVLMEAWRKA